MECEVIRCHKNVEGSCSEGYCANFYLYREATGKCETCGAELDSHPRCEACGILCGPGHLMGKTSKCRDHDLCGYCVGAWKRLEKVIGRKALWQEFLSPQPKIFGWW